MDYDLRCFDFDTQGLQCRSHEVVTYVSGTFCNLCVGVGACILVEPMGFEPTTSSMPSRRAPNCATAPPGQFRDVSIRALASSMRGRQSVVVDARNIIMPSLEFSTNPDKRC